MTLIGHAVARGSWLPAFNRGPGFSAVAAAMCDAIVGIHQAVVATIRVGSVNGVVPVWLIGCVEVELAHLGEVALRRVVDE